MNNQVTAQLRFVRMSPRKLRLVVDTIRGRSVSHSIAHLSVMNKKGANLVLKLLQSAVANAKHNHDIVMEDLRVKSITVDGGPSLKRFMPKAHGRATPVRERTSHVKLALEKIIRKEKKSTKK